MLDKHACLDVELEAGTVRLTAQAKGAGMISPQFATLLCFVQTDAAMSPETCDLLLGVTVKRSFERVSVDGQLSTSDTVILQASGESGIRIEPETEDEVRFGEALDALLRQLALYVVRDGEGARRICRVVVRGGDDRGRRTVSRALSATRRWSRPRSTAAIRTGAASSRRSAWRCRAPRRWRSTSPSKASRCVVAGSTSPHDADALRDAVQRDEIEYEIGLPGEGAETERFFSDLGHEYVTLNAEYTT